MGIVEQELAAFELSDGTKCTAEYNRNGVVHIHIGRTRMDLKPDEFRHFASVVAHAKNELHEVKEDQ